MDQVKQEVLKDYARHQILETCKIIQIMTSLFNGIRHFSILL